MSVTLVICQERAPNIFPLAEAIVKTGLGTLESFREGDYEASAKSNMDHTPGEITFLPVSKRALKVMDSLFIYMMEQWREHGGGGTVFAMRLYEGRRRRLDSFRIEICPRRCRTPRDFRQQMDAIFKDLNEYIISWTRKEKIQKNGK